MSRIDKTPWDWEALRELSLREASRVLRSRDQAEDAAQDAVIRAWRFRGSCRDPRDPRPWVAAIARREALRRAKGNGRENGGPPRGVEMDVAAHDQIDRTPLRVDVMRAVSALEPAEQRLLDLRYRRDLTQRDVAAELGLPEGTVKVRLHRLRGLLRERLQ